MYVLGCVLKFPRQLGVIHYNPSGSGRSCVELVLNYKSVRTCPLTDIDTLFELQGARSQNFTLWWSSGPRVPHICLKENSWSIWLVKKWLPQVQDAIIILWLALSCLQGMRQLITNVDNWLSQEDWLRGATIIDLQIHLVAMRSVITTLPIHDNELFSHSDLKLYIHNLEWYIL